MRKQNSEAEKTELQEHMQDVHDRNHQEHHDGHEHEGHCGCSHDHDGHNHDSHDQEHHHDGACHDDGCGCGHDHGAEAEKSTGFTVLKYVLGAIPVILAFIPFIPTVVRVIMAVAAYLFFGFEVWREMIENFASKKIFTEFTLMCAATVGAFAIGEYADAAAVMYLYSLGEQISGRAYARSRGNISELIRIIPEQAQVLRDGKMIFVSPTEVETGEIIQVNAGEKIPLDGVVADGGGSADTSAVTGESMPLSLYEGVACPSGSILLDGAVRLRVSGRYETSVVARLADAVKEASARKSRSEKKIARFARIFTPLAFVVAALITLVGFAVSGEFIPWLKAGLNVLVVSCPCSLVLSVPLTYFAGIGTAAKKGIVFRGGEIMDGVAGLTAICFDKTGTLTDSVLSFDGAETYGDMTKENFMRLAYDVLLNSPHAAAVTYCGNVHFAPSYRVEQVENVGGRGIVCLADGKQALFGNGALLREHGIPCEDSRITAIFGAYDGKIVGKLSFSSHLKKGATEALSGLRREGVTSQIVLSGDAPDSVKLVCEEAGIGEYYAALTPAGKSEQFEEVVRREKSANKKATVGFCGDGMNDSAVIARADVGIAMGKSGSALTVTSADMVIMDDDLNKITEAMRIAKKTSRIAGMNIALSLGIKIAVLLAGVLLTVFTSAGFPMELAIVADVGAAVIAALNSLRAGR